MASSPSAASKRRGRYLWGNPSPGAEVVALSPRSLMATYRFWCEVCNKGFQREQNLQLHRRGHNLPVKLKEKTKDEVKKKVYTCPEVSCVHHDPSRALGDLTAIKKHFSRKHSGEKKISCDKCNKKFAVHCDWKAHNKICATKEYICECGTTFSRPESFAHHRSICDALTEKVARHTTNRSPHSSMAAGILANASNPSSMSLGPTADLLIPWSHQQLLTPLPGQGASSPYSFTSLLSGKSNGSAFNSYWGALGDVMSGGGVRGGGSTLQQYGTYDSAGGYGGGVEPLSDQMNAAYGGMMYKVNNADGMLVGEVNNNVLVDPQMNVQSEYRDMLTRDFPGMGNGMNSLCGGGKGGDDQNGNGMGNTSAEARPFVPRGRSCF